jgi:hypothetical protein
VDDTFFCTSHYFLIKYLAEKLLGGLDDPPGDSELEFLNNLLGIGTEEELSYRTGRPGYIDWRNSFLGIDSWTP